MVRIRFQNVVGGGRGKKHLRITEAAESSGDPLEAVLPPAAEAELDAADKIDKTAQADQAEEEVTVVAAKARKQAEAEPAEASSSSHPAPSSSCFFNKSLGITDVSFVSRRNMLCYHCGSTLAKGDVRFVYAFNAKRPPRSIYTSCLAQIPKAELASSISCIEKHLNSKKLPDLQSQACSEALSVLRALM